MPSTRTALASAHIYTACLSALISLAENSRKVARAVVSTADESPGVALSQDWKSCAQHSQFGFPDAVGSKAPARMKINSLRLWANK